MSVASIPRTIGERELEKQRAYVEKEAEYIRRNIAGVNSFQAKGKRKRLERLPATVHKIADQPERVPGLVEADLFQQ